MTKIYIRNSTCKTDRRTYKRHLLVEFKPEAEVGFFDISAMELELSHLLGIKVDMRTAAELSRHFREHVIREAETQYVH